MLENTNITDKVIKVKFLTTGLNREMDVQYTTPNGVMVLSKRIENDRSVSDKAVFDVVKVEIASVDGTDFIGITTEKTNVYATSQDESDILLNLKVEPVGFTLPNNFITWSGGTAGVSQLQRKVSRINLNEAGELLVAAYGSMDIRARFYIFEREPDPGDVEKDITIIQDNSVVNVPFGKAQIEAALSPEIEFEIYYKDKKWCFVFKKVKYEIKWGIKSDGHVDAISGDMNPFPNGFGMPENSTQYDRKVRAKGDLTPTSEGFTRRMSYWSSRIIIQHENFHITDWIDNYYPNALSEAEDEIERQELEVTLDNLNPNYVLFTKDMEFFIIVRTKTEFYLGDYSREAELRANMDGKDEYQSLADSIIP